MLKSSKRGIRLNDKDCCVIKCENDEKPKFLLDMTHVFSELNPHSPPEKMRRTMLTVDTSEALSLTFPGIVQLTKVLLKQGLSYVMLGEFQSDRVEGKFGFYRQRAGVNYFISVDRVLNGLRLQKLKLFKTLLFE